MGLEESASTVFLIDFGLAKKWRNPVGEHIPYKDGKNLTGTARYVSANTHRGIEQARRDDLEGIGYLLLYLLMGQLPWQGLPTKNKEEKYRRIKEIKLATTLQELCEGYPQEFHDYMHHCRQLEFTNEPDYAYLRRLFRDLYERCNFDNEYVFDWTIQRYHARLSQEAFAAELGLRSPGHSHSSGGDSNEAASLENKQASSDGVDLPQVDVGALQAMDAQLAATLSQERHARQPTKQ